MQTKKPPQVDIQNYFKTTARNMKLLFAKF